MTQLVPYVFQNATGTLPLSQLDSDLEYVSGKWVSVKDAAYGAKGDGTTDDTAAIQAAVTAAGNSNLYFPPGNYKITSQINILRSVHIFAKPFTATIYIGAANINGFVIGDGTQPTNTITTSTCIDGLQFAVLSGVPASTSGSCIWINFAHYVVIRNISLVGTAGAKVLWNGLLITESIEWIVQQPLVNSFRNNGIRITGTVGKTCGDGRIDFAEVIGCLGDAVYMGDYTGAITYNSCIHDNNVGWNIKIDCTQAAGVGANYFINQPDIEATNVVSCLGGIYVKQGTAQIVGGWLGGTAGLQVDALGSSVSMIGTLNQALVPVVISGAACSLIGCDIAGDNVTSTTGVTLNAGATDTNIVGGRIRQFITEGVKFVGAPARCTITGVNFRSNGTDITSPTSDLNSTVAPKGTTTPTVTSGTNAFTSVAATLGWSKPDDRVEFTAAITITTNGTAATSIIVPLPFTPAVNSTGAGIIQNTGVSCSVTINTNGTAIVRMYDGTYPGADGRVILISGVYRV